ncbi:MAG: tetratricopeptide repeat protein [Candidatus Thorarchaeota archaeon]
MPKEKKDHGIIPSHSDSIKTNNINNLFEKALILGTTDKNEETLTYLNRILEVEPLNNIALYLKSLIYEKLGMFSEKSDFFEKAIVIKHLRKKVDIIRMLNLLDKCMETYSHDLNGLYIRWILVAELQKKCEGEEWFFYLEQSLKILEKAIEFHDKVTDFDLGYRFIWDKIDFHAKGINHKVERNSKFCSDEPIILFQYALLGQVGMYNQVLFLLEFLLEHNIKSSCILSNMGIALTRQFKKEDEAAEFFKKALEIDPNYIYALNNIGVFTDSAEYFDKVLELDNLNFVACFNKSLNLFRKSSYDDKNPTKQALYYCEKALTIRPQDKFSLHLLGSIYRSLGNYELAIKTYDNALRYAPNNINILEDQANLLIEMERYKEALVYLDKATELEPGDMNLWEEKVDIYKKIKDVEGEFNCYEDMLKISPEYTEASVGKGKVLVDRGKYDEAIKLLDEVEGMMNWDNLWPIAIFHKARAAALQNDKNKAFQLIGESIRAGAAFNGLSGELDIKKLIKESHDFDQYRNLKVFKSILAQNYNTKEETDKFWSKY